MWMEPGMGLVQSSGRYAAYLQRRESPVSPYDRSVLMIQRCSRARGKVSLAEGFDGDTMGGKRPGSDYVRPLHLPSEFCYISRRREGGRERRDGRGYCEWKSKCFSDSHGDVLRWTQREAAVLLSAGQVSSAALTALSCADDGLLFASKGRDGDLAWNSLVFMCVQLFWNTEAKHFSYVLFRLVNMDQRVSWNTNINLWDYANPQNTMMWCVNPLYGFQHIVFYWNIFLKAAPRQCDF